MNGSIEERCAVIIEYFEKSGKCAPGAMTPALVRRTVASGGSLLPLVDMSDDAATWLAGYAAGVAATNGGS